MWYINGMRAIILLGLCLLIGTPIFPKFDYTDYPSDVELNPANHYPDVPETEYYDDGKYGVLLPAEFSDNARYPYYLQL